MKYNKSDEMMEFLDTITKNYKGRTLSESWEKQICVWCGEPAIEFTDTLSLKEYTISGFCQKCQDETFGADDDGDFM